MLLLLVPGVGMGAGGIPRGPEAWHGQAVGQAVAEIAGDWDAARAMPASTEEAPAHRAGRIGGARGERWG